MLCRRGSNFAGGREDILEEGFERPAMIARSGVDDDGSVLAIAANFAHRTRGPFRRRRTLDAPSVTYNRSPLIWFI